MTTTISVAGLFLALFLLVYLAFKGPVHNHRTKPWSCNWVKSTPFTI